LANWDLEIRVIPKKYYRDAPRRSNNIDVCFDKESIARCFSSGKKKFVNPKTPGRLRPLLKLVLSGKKGVNALFVFFNDFDNPNPKPEGLGYVKWEIHGITNNPNPPVGGLGFGNQGYSEKILSRCAKEK